MIWIAVTCTRDLIYLERGHLYERSNLSLFLNHDNYIRHENRWADTRKIFSECTVLYITESNENGDKLRRPKAIVTNESKLNKKNTNDGEEEEEHDDKSSGEEWDAPDEKKITKKSKSKKKRKSKIAAATDENSAENEDEEMQFEQEEEELEEETKSKKKTTKKPKKNNTKQPANIIAQIKSNVTKDSKDVDSTLTDIKRLRNKQHENSKNKATTESDGMRFLRTDTDAITIGGVEPSDGDSDDEEDVINTQRMNIRDAFANDDVIEDFIQEKESEVEKSKPKAVDSVLPGWGDWGGAGMKVSTRKRKRFTFVPVPEKKRLDDGKSNVIINEVRNKHLAKHQVTELLFFFSLLLFCSITEDWNSKKMLPEND